MRRGRRNTNKKRKNDYIYNIMLFQIFLVTLLVGIFYLSIFVENSTLTSFVSDIRRLYDTEQIVHSEEESTYNYNYLTDDTSALNIRGSGGYNEYKLHINENEVQVPANCSLAPIIISQPLLPPTSGVVTSEFGYRINPITKTEDFHKGIDIAASMGSDINAVLGGIVQNVGEDDINGKFIEIAHTNGISTKYTHCSEIIAKIHTIIRKGERIAKVGSTGYSTGPHLHFEIAVDGICYDPAWLYSYEQI